MKTAGGKRNRLADEKSPYLLQHADNPVEWFPWGEEAFEKARRENKPIFLSIGYATCHWCHVMERESFENPEVAGILNRHFVSIKVDREERPDVDQIYMNALTRVMREHGGWPLSMWLTPDLEPFVGGTYFPPEDRFGRAGFKSLLRQIAALWEKNEDQVRRSAGEIAEVVRKAGSVTAEGELRREFVADALPAFDEAFDDADGAFFPSSGTNFPQPSLASFLLRHHARTGMPRSLEIVETQLRKMARGGIYDHLGGGFARYSTDKKWMVPHFEKMLYDNAQLLKLYAETYRITRRAEYARVIRETADYVLRDMTGPEGGFYSAEDADSDGVEGKFYVWRLAEVVETLGERDARVFGRAFDVSEEGNWADAYHDTTGLNILNRKRTAAEVAVEEGLEVGDVEKILDSARRRLFERRQKRVRPGLDDKVLTSWNGLMIGALAYAGSTLGEERYVRAARKGAEFVHRNLCRDGRLLHRCRDGEARVEGLLPDYACFVSGLLDLYEAALEEKWLVLARDLNREMIGLFEDSGEGGFYMSRAGRTDLIARSRDVEDGALPSSNNLALVNLVRLGEYGSDDSLRKKAERIMTTFGAAIEGSPVALPNMLLALDWLFGPSRQIVLAGDPAEMLKVAHRHFLPATVILGSGVDAGRFPLVAGKAAPDGKPAAYVCENSACRLPVTDPTELEKTLSLE